MSSLLQVLALTVGAALAAFLYGGSGVEIMLAAAAGALLALRLDDARRIRALERRLDAQEPGEHGHRAPALPTAVDRPAPDLRAAEPPALDRPAPERPVLDALPGGAPRRPRRPTRRPDARPRAERPPAERPAREPAEGSVEATVRDGLARAVAFVTGGNLVARIALLVTFVGVVLLVRYAAEQGFFPIEVRLAGSAALGLALVGVGWRVRETSRAFALTVQGGGVAVLYLTIYAATALFGLLPPFLALVLMALVASGGAALAVVQDAPALALIGFLGGFLAPMLVGTDAGNHVLLFGYYTALNVGVLGISWLRGWRSLALLGFACTFVIGGLWGGLSYRPELYASTQPFLAVFFAIYFALAIHFARRAIRADTPPERVLVVDGTLVFGLPAATFVLQRGLVEAFPYGDAWSAAALAAVYLAAWVWLRADRGVRLLADAFLAVGLAFATLALPLAFQRVLVGALWVLEGAALVWTGARQRKAWMRWGGLALQLAAAAVLFRQGVLDPDEAFGPETLTGWIVAVALGLSAYVLHRYRPSVEDWETVAAHGLLVAALLWWGASGFVHAVDLLPDDGQIAALVGFAALSAAALLAGGRALAWPAMRISGFGLIPVGFVLWLVGTFSSDHAFGDFGWASWPLALGVLVAALVVNRRPGSDGRVAAVTTTFWLVALVLAGEAGWAAGRAAPGAGWGAAAVGAVLAAALAGLLVVPASLADRAASRRGLGATALGLAVAVVAWTAASGTASGGPSPIPYLPVLNPLGLATLAVLAALVVYARWLVEPARRALGWAMAGVAGFVGLTFEVARSVHHLVSVPYGSPSLFGSATFQAALAVAWTVLALALTLTAVRLESRPMWIFGASVLAAVVVKLFLVDLSQTDSLVRIAAFFAVGLLGLWIAYQAPLPPKHSEAPEEPGASPRLSDVVPPRSDGG